MNPPSLMSNSSSGAFQIFNLTTGDTGASYQAWEEFKYDAPPMGGLYTWGSNSDGILGQNNQTGYSSPIQVGTGDDWTGMSSSDVFNYAQAATKADVVETLNVDRLSPPVPTISRQSYLVSNLKAFSCIDFAIPAISSSDSPFSDNDVRIKESLISDTLPDII